MKFIDTNVFAYAILETKRELDSNTKKIKDLAKKILKRIEKDEKIVTTFVHISELSNIMKNFMSPRETAESIERIIDNDNIIFMELHPQFYRTAIELSQIYNINLNDALAVAVMQNLGILEIYSFDKHFDKIQEIKRITV